MDTREEIIEVSTQRMGLGFQAMDRCDWMPAAEHFLTAACEREFLPWKEDAESAWMLTAAWMNHGDMLVRSGEPSLQREAIHSFERTIEVVESAGLDGRPAFQDRVILAWLNRASACCELGEIDAALEDYSKAEAALNRWGDSMDPPRSFLAVMLRINRSRTLILAGRPLEARLEAKEGISRLRLMETNPETAAAGIRGRSLLCRALAMLLDEPGGAGQVGDWIAEATDAAEEALTLARSTGVSEQGMADLVRYGAMIYQVCQPHFLGEFLAEWLGSNGPLAGDAPLRQEMKNLLWMAVEDAKNRALAAPHETEFMEKQTRIVVSLQAGLRLLS